MILSSSQSVCISCGDIYPRARYNLGLPDNPILTCLECGEKEARKVHHCIVPMNKSVYQVVTDRSILAQLNPKRTI